MKKYTTLSKKLEYVLARGIIRIVTDVDFNNKELKREDITVWGFFPYNTISYEEIWQGDTSNGVSGFVSTVYRFISQ